MKVRFFFFFFCRIDVLLAEMLRLSDFIKIIKNRRGQATYVTRAVFYFYIWFFHLGKARADKCE